MNIYVIFLKTEPNYLLLTRLISDYPELKKGFKCREILKLSSLSFNDKKALKEMFGGNYSSIHTPTINFEYRNGKWEVEEIDVQRLFHQRVTQVLNNALNEGKYPLGSPVSTKDRELFEFLTKENNCWFQREFSVSEEEYGIPITQDHWNSFSINCKKDWVTQVASIMGLSEHFWKYSGIMMRKC